MKINPTDLAEVLEKLMEAFPDELPKQQTTVEQIHIKIGEQKPIKYLMDIYERLTGGTDG